MQLKAGTYLQGGKYEIVRTLGQGGFGITYEALQVGLGRKVAVKEFFMKDCCERDEETIIVTVPTQSNRELVDKFKAKFLREARMIASFDHAHIVRVTDVYEENGTAYYVMDNLPGGSLTERVKKEGPLSEAQAEKYIRQVADALAYIHERNTLHLDVKPSNILLNAKGEAVLIDFGISKHYDKAGEQTSSTPVGISKGYAPLEQGRDGDVSQFGPSTDIYALGATLCHLVSGQVPPEASIVNEDGLEKPEGVSDRIWNVITQAMQPRRKDRPQSIAEFLQLFDAAPAPAKEDVDETVVITKKDPAKEPKVDKHGEDEKKPFKVWLWIVLGVVAIAIVIAVILGKKSPSPQLEEPVNPVVDTIETVVTQAPAKKPEATDITATEKPAFVQQRTQASSSPKSGSDNGHEWVNLGLPSGTKWATCNVGASSPSDNGNYYAWGETSTKSEYSWSSLKYCTDTPGNHFNKYVSSRMPEYWSGSGSPDNKTRLELSDDAARANWGGKWRIPTKAQCQELKSKCTWTWTGSGYKVTGPNGQIIILPAAGWREISSLYGVGSMGYYWSSSLIKDAPYDAWRVGFDSGSHYINYYNRCLGLSVRPVTE